MKMVLVIQAGEKNGQPATYILYQGYTAKLTTIMINDGKPTSLIFRKDDLSLISFEVHHA
jgi:hypothetical protein